jgi:hypothetical protein
MVTNQSWETSVILSLRDRGGDCVDLQHIYDRIENYRSLISEDHKITFNQPNYRHTVRSTLAKLKNFGVVERPDRGMYSFTKRGKSFLPLFEKGISWERIDKPSFWKYLEELKNSLNIV